MYKAMIINHVYRDKHLVWTIVFILNNITQFGNVSNIFRRYAINHLVDSVIGIRPARLHLKLVRELAICF